MESISVTIAGPVDHVAGAQLAPVVDVRPAPCAPDDVDRVRRPPAPRAGPVALGAARSARPPGAGPVTVARALTSSWSTASRKENSRSCSASNASASRASAASGSSSQSGSTSTGSRSPARGSGRRPGSSSVCSAGGDALLGQPAAGVLGQLAQEVGRARRRSGRRSGAARCGPTRRAGWWWRRRARTARPGDGGTITGQAPVSTPSALACSGPAPPKATSAKSRGSKPCCTETSRSPPSMFSLTMSTIPAAAASGTRQPHRLGDLADGGPGRVDVQRDLAAGQRRRQVAEHHVRVGHGRLGAALAVGGRAGVGARGLRADPQRPGQLGHVRDRAAARADRAHVHAGRPHGQVADLGLAADPRASGPAPARRRWRCRPCRR